MSKSTFTNLSADLDNIQKLDDLPNAVGGLSADELKAEFDKAGDTIKSFINSTLLPELAKENTSASGASRIGIEPLVALPGVNNVMDAISTLITLITAASVPDGSITEPKLDASAVTTPKVADGAITGAKLGAGSVSGPKCDFSSGLTIAGNLTQQGQIILDSDCYGDELPEPGTPGRLFFRRVQ